MNEYFRPSYCRWFYSPATFWSNLWSTIRWFKWSWQRAFRGYADCDVWNMFNYLNTIIIPMLEHLREFNSGFPTECTDAAQWKGILNQMIEGFKSSERISNLDYPGDVTTWNVQINKDEKIFADSMKLFSKYYLALWD